eukprot:g1662.t1
MGILEKIKEIEHEMKITQKNKATSTHLGLLKARLCKLRRQLLNPEGSKGSSGPGEGFAVAKAGDARVALIGFPSVGKSSLLANLTNTKSEAAAYEFTTLTCIPGNIMYNDVKIQLLDLPGIIEGAAHGKGRGREVVAVAKTSDVILMVLDAAKEGTKINHRAILENELRLVGLRLNERPPDVTYVKKKEGGLKFNSTVKLTQLGEDPEKMVRNILREYKVHNATVLVREDISVDQLIDVIMGNRKYVKCLYLYNKVDMIPIEEVDRLARLPHSLVCSVVKSLNMDRLLARLWKEMGLVRVYTRRRGEPPVFAEPLILSKYRNGISVESACRMLHKDMLEKFNYANVWGTSVKHSPLRCGLQHELQDEDVLQIFTKTNQQQKRDKDYAEKCQKTYDEYKLKRKNKKPLKT